MLGLETVVELLGDPLDVEAGATVPVTSTSVRCLFSSRLTGDVFEPLDQRIAGSGRGRSDARGWPAACPARGAPIARPAAGRLRRRR